MTDHTHTHDVGAHSHTHSIDTADTAISMSPRWDRLGDVDAAPSTNDQCAGSPGSLGDGTRCENDAEVAVRVHAYLGFGHYGWIYANVCDSCATAGDGPQIPNTAPLQWDGVQGEIVGPEVGWTDD